MKGVEEEEEERVGAGILSYISVYLLSYLLVESWFWIRRMQLVKVSSGTYPSLLLKRFDLFE